MFKVNNKDTRTMCVCFELYSTVIIAEFEQADVAWA